ncbi:MAG: thioesterase family protein [Thermoleophilia bacterium]|nr:thioesterase family protein [Thermoleophilia bacterium]
MALRAVGAASAFSRPASFTCHYLRPAAAGPVEVGVESRRQTRRAESLRVTLAQADGPILEALVWTVADLTGTDHDAAAAPEAPGLDEVEPWDAHLPGGEPPFPFWRNFDVRAVDPHPTGDGRASRGRSAGRACGSVRRSRTRSSTPAGCWSPPTPRCSPPRSSRTTNCSRTSPRAWIW